MEPPELQALLRDVLIRIGRRRGVGSHAVTSNTLDWEITLRSSDNTAIGHYTRVAGGAAQRHQIDFAFGADDVLIDRKRTVVCDRHPKFLVPLRIPNILNPEEPVAS